MSDLRCELLAAANALQIETNGFLPASGFNQMIDRSILPHTSPADAELEDFLPVVVSANGNNEPIELLPEHGTAAKVAKVGAVACLGNRAIFAWMTGFVRLKFHSYVLDYSAISKVELIVYNDAYRELKGIDITEGHKWTVLFAERLPAAVVDDFATRLAHCLQVEDKAR